MGDKRKKHRHQRDTTSPSSPSSSSTDSDSDSDRSSKRRRRHRREKERRRRSDGSSKRERESKRKEKRKKRDRERKKSKRHHYSDESQSSSDEELQHRIQPQTALREMMTEFPNVGNDLKQLLQMIDTGQAVDIKDISEKSLVKHLKNLFLSLNLKENGDRVFLLPSKSPPTLDVVGPLIQSYMHPMNDRADPSAALPETCSVPTEQMEDDPSIKPPEDHSVGPRKRVIGPAMPSAELLAAAAKLTEAQTAFIEAELDDDTELFVGPPPPAMVSEAESANEAERFEEVTRIMDVEIDSPYDVLGVNHNMSDGNIKKKYWKISLLVHPDKCSHPQANQAFIKLNKAFKELQDPEKRKAMDDKIKLKQEQEDFKAELKVMRETALWRRSQGISMEGDDELLAQTEVKVEPKRDEWMTTLPPERKPGGMTMQSTQFSRETKEGRGDTSIWTDTPNDRVQKAKMNYLEAYNQATALASNEEENKRANTDADLVDKYNKAKRSKTLVQKHQEEVASKSKKKSKQQTEKGEKEWVSQHPWKPWDREKDLTAGFTPKTLPSPWAQVVRGGEVESPTGIHQSLPSSSSSSSSSLTTGASDQAPSSDHSSKEISTPQQSKEVSAPQPPVVENSVKTVDTSDGSDGNAGRSKKPAWNKPSNGVVIETGPVMGAESWPALSESAKISAKSIAESASKVASAEGSTSTSQAPVISHPPQRHGTSNPRPGSATNSNMPNRLRPIRPVGGINIGHGPSHTQSSLSNPPTPPPLPPFPVYQLPPVNFRNMGPSIPDSSPRDHHRNNTWDARPLVGGSPRRGSFGTRTRGDGSYHHNNYSNRRDQDRGNYVNTRDAHVSQPRMPPRGILRHPPPPPSTAAFLGPQPIAPFPNPVAYPDVYYFPAVPLDPFRGMPFFPPSPSPATVYPAAESSFSNVIVNQIDYYFSDTNLVKDEFLKQNMDEEGWVSITVIANFPRVKSLTSNVQLLLDSMKNSTVVDVKGDKLRRRYDWMKWLSSSQVQVDSGSVSPSESSYNNLAADLQTINLETTKAEGESQHSNGGDDAGNTN